MATLAKRNSTVLLGAAGEHHVLSQLLRRNMIAAAAPQGAPNTDIIVTDLNGNRLCTIQVKSRRDLGTDGGWHMGEKHESIVGDRLFYCFVDFGRSLGDLPKVHVIPSRVVADVLHISHRVWLSTPGKNGRQRKNTKMRRLVPDYSYASKPAAPPFPTNWMDEYLDAWKLLEME